MPIRFRDKKGHFIKAEDRYSGKVAKVEAFRRKRWITIMEGEKVTPESLAIVTNRKEFESFPAAFEVIKLYKPKGKYQVWNLAEQIDETRGIRRKLIKITMDVKDGRRLRKISAFMKINRNQSSSYRLFQRMNDVLSANDMFAYDKIGNRLLTERKGKKVTIVGAKVEEVI